MSPRSGTASAHPKSWLWLCDGASHRFLHWNFFPPVAGGTSCHGLGGRCRRTSRCGARCQNQRTQRSHSGCWRYQGCATSQPWSSQGTERGAAQPHPATAFSQSCRAHPSLGQSSKSSPLQDVPAPERARAPSLHAGAGCCLDGSCCAGGSLRNIFPLPKDCSSGARPCKHNECHLIAAALGLGLLGNGCVANILNNSLCNVCPGYCGIHFIIRALGCTLLIILSNNLHSTVSV